jgi:hypothetical protein
MAAPKILITKELQERLRIALLKKVAEKKRHKQKPTRQFIYHDGQVHLVN